MEIVLIVLGAVLLWLGLKVYGQPRVGDRIAYWHQTIPGLNETPDRFYAQVHQALKEGLQLRDISLSGFGFGPERLFETRSLLGERPLYLCVRYKHLSYYLYVSQTPAGFFLSTWLYNKYLRGGDGEGRLAPTLLARLYFARQTLFQHDAVLMFQESVHTIVMEVLDRYMNEQQMKPLEGLERRPVLHAFYRGLPHGLSSHSNVPHGSLPQSSLPQSGFAHTGSMPAAMTEAPGSTQPLSR